MTFLVTRPGRAFAFPAAGLSRAGGVAVDIEETAEAFRVDLDLPDVAAEAVRIELRDNEIRVSGSYRDRVRTGTMHHRARPEGEFEFLIALPGEVDPDRVEANLDSGVLTVVAPKARGEQARRITVHGKPRQQDRPQAAQAARPVGAQQQERPADTPAAQAKQMREGQSRPGPASQQVGTTGTGSTGQVGRSTSH